MNIKKYAPLGLATMLILGSIVSTTSANEGKGGLMRGFRGQNTVIATAIESGDYDAWVKAVSVNGQMPEFLKVITKDNFDQFVEMHQLIKKGKKEEAKAIADELGLKLMGQKGPGPMPDPLMNEAARAALESGDYDAWVKAVSVNGQMPEPMKTVTKDNFAQFAEAMKLQKQGMDLIQQSHEILKSIGVNPPGPDPMMKAKRFERGRGERFGQEANETNSED